jgi:hypothetical protein
MTIRRQPTPLGWTIFLAIVGAVRLVVYHAINTAVLRRVLADGGRRLEPQNETLTGDTVHRTKFFTRPCSANPGGGARIVHACVWTLAAA